MGTAARSPLLGYNHNVRYRGRIFHVQTEDSGPANPHLFTHLYYEGTILASKRLEYDREEPEEMVRILMQGQHKTILKELKQAKHDERIGTFFASRNEPFETIELPEGLSASAPPPTPAEPVAEVQPTLDLDALPPLEETLAPPPVEPLPSLRPRPMAGGTGAYSMKGNTQDRPFEGAPRRQRAGRPPPPPAKGVVVQRHVVVGSGTSSPAARPRRPHGPYVVKEGSHPMSAPPRPAPGSVPPAHSLSPHPADPSGAPLTSAERAKAPAVEMISDKSLDEVILAYLSQETDQG
jgi:hypothetical protein